MLSLPSPTGSSVRSISFRYVKIKLTSWVDFFIVQITPPLLNGIREYTFLIFGVVNIIFIPFMYVLPPPFSPLNFYSPCL